MKLCVCISEREVKEAGGVAGRSIVEVAGLNQQGGGKGGEGEGLEV